METTFLTSYHAKKAYKLGHEMFHGSLYSLNHCTVVIFSKIRKFQRFLNSFQNQPKTSNCVNSFHILAFDSKWTKNTFCLHTNNVYATSHISSSTWAACEKQSKPNRSEKCMGNKKKSKILNNRKKNLRWNFEENL